MNPIISGQGDIDTKATQGILQTLEMFISRFIHLMEGADPTVDQALI